MVAPATAVLFSYLAKENLSLLVHVNLLKESTGQEAAQSPRVSFLSISLVLLTLYVVTVNANLLFDFACLN